MKYTVPFAELARQWGVTRAYIWQRAKRAGLNTRGGLTEREVQILAELMNRRVPQKEDW
jgi:hypothetical protein